jgi:hypothetical protein
VLALQCGTSGTGGDSALRCAGGGSVWEFVCIGTPVLPLWTSKHFCWHKWMISPFWNEFWQQELPLDLFVETGGPRECSDMWYLWWVWPPWPWAAAAAGAALLAPMV